MNSNKMTESEAKEFYGEDAAEWLRRWDEGKTVWTIEMGGLGPGYEQVIAILTAEILRYYVGNAITLDLTDKEWQKIREERDAELFRKKSVSELGCSGAQMGAAANVAGHLYRHGPWKVMQDEEVKDRHIQVRKDFP